jgi:threonine dehydrogenase-like Zn-dependent dehydrogenase
MAIPAPGEVADPIITHHFPLDRIGEAFHTYVDRVGNALKVVLHV